LRFVEEFGMKGHEVVESLDLSGFEEQEEGD